MLVLMTGCEATQKAFKSPSELKTPDLFREIDPTGAISEGEARKETWETITKKMKALDVEGLNRAVVELADATRTLSQRMESVPAADLQTLSENLAAAAVSIRSQVEALQLDQTAVSLRQVTETLNAKADDLNTQSVEDIMLESNALVIQVREMLEAWDCQVRAGLEDAREVITHTDERVQSLPFSELREALLSLQGSVSVLRESAGGIPATNRFLDETLSAVRWAAYAAIVVLALVGGRILFGAGRGRGKSTPTKTGGE